MASRGAQEAPRWPQDGPKTIPRASQDPSNMLQRDPGEAPRHPRASQSCPNLFQDHLVAQKFFQNLPKSTLKTISLSLPKQKSMERLGINMTSIRVKFLFLVIFGKFWKSYSKTDVTMKILAKDYPYRLILSFVRLKNVENI